jgi:hypothetical protein
MPRTNLSDSDESLPRIQKVLADSDEKLLTLQEFCAGLRAGPKTVYRLRKAGMRYLALNSRKYLYFASELRRLLSEAQTRAATNTNP